MSTSNKLSRRQFIKRTGLVGAGAIFPIGRSRTGAILKGLIPADELIPGVSHWLNSTCAECSAGCGVQVRIRERNTVKIEGNAAHPVNHGGLCARGQSALQALYGPARIRTPLLRNGEDSLQPAGWPDISEAFATYLDTSGSKPAGQIAVVTSHVTGGLAALLTEHIDRIPESRLITHEPADYAAVAAANRLCFGIDAIPTYRLEEAETIVSFGADLFETWLSPVSFAHAFSQKRKPDRGVMSRLVQFESHMSVTGANADDRYCVPPGAETLVALTVANLMLKDGTLPPDQLEAWRVALKPYTLERAVQESGVSVGTIESIAQRLSRETPVLAIAGGPNSRSEHATAIHIVTNLINYIAGSYGKTITFERVENAPVGTARQIAGLVEAAETGRIRVLIVNEANLEFAFPDPERLRAAIKKIPLKVQLASVRDTSTEWYDIVLPTHHWLERWDWLEPRSGLHCIQQPMIDPWCDSRHPGEVLSDILTVLGGGTDGTPVDYEAFLRDRWNRIRVEGSYPGGPEDFWRHVLTDGGHWTTPPSHGITLDATAAQSIREIELSVPTPAEPALLPITTVRYGSGRQTDRPWLNELPDPITTIVWDSPMIISPATAERWKCKPGDVVTVECGNRTLKGPVHIQPGTSDAVLAVSLGAPSSENVAFNYEPDTHPLHRVAGTIDNTSHALSWTGTTAAFKGIAARTRLAYVQAHDRQEGRGIARAVGLNESEAGAKHDSLLTTHEHDLYPKHKHPEHDWTMVIDLSACIGCGACSVACYADNNIAVVGKNESLLGRELAWMRIERFIDHGRIVFLPMLCQHCEHAPCETVCPVYAALHSNEGLNQQVYNRCVGTRYCANNCPYKVRRFNWYTYKTVPPLEKQFNPDVYVRSRGIMEKCTFCVHRIREHKHIAKDEKRPLRDGEVTPACAQSCPTGAITFGDLNDSASRVAKLIKDPRGYTIFGHLNTQPSVVYLKRVYHPDGTPVEEI